MRLGFILEAESCLCVWNAYLFFIFSQIVFFCGHLPICQKFNNHQAFVIAKSNVEKYYSVVGITENMQETLTVMEALIPRFFDGAYETYFRNEEQILMNKNKDDIPIFTFATIYNCCCTFDEHGSMFFERVRVQS